MFDTETRLRFLHSRPTFIRTYIRTELVSDVSEWLTFASCFVLDNQILFERYGTLLYGGEDLYRKKKLLFCIVIRPVSTVYFENAILYNLSSVKITRVCTRQFRLGSTFKSRMVNIVKQVLFYTIGPKRVNDMKTVLYCRFRH